MRIINGKLNIFKTKISNLYCNNEAAIILADSLKTLKQIRNDSVNLVFADPPYNIGKTFGSRKEFFTKEGYLTWCKEWIDECMRILKPTGVFVFMSATQFMPYLDCYVDSKFSVISRIVWYYDSSGVQAKRNFGSMYEPIVVVAKDKKKYVFNSENVMVEAKTGAVRKLIDYRKSTPQQYNTKKVLGNVWNIPRVRYKMDEYETHPAQKPERLMENIILAFSNEGDVVLDPFAGTFTTCAVAQKHNRLGIGIEMEEEYYKIGLRRLGISDSYKGKKLIKKKGRVTKNKSKKDHQKLNSSL